MKSNSLWLRAFLMVAVAVSLSLTVAIGKNDGKGVSRSAGYLVVPSSAGATAVDSRSATVASPSTRDSAAMAQYCSEGNYLGHYYDYAYGNHDGREFFYFQRNWMSVCVR